MGSVAEPETTAVTVNFPCVAVVNKDRLERAEKVEYMNIECPTCKEWWIMICLDQKKIRCPWCGQKVKK